MGKVIIVRVAIFDFDGTLYRKETFKLLMSHLKNHPIYNTKYGQFFRWVAPRFAAYKMKIYPEARMKERSMQKYISVLDELTKKELEDLDRNSTRLNYSHVATSYAVYCLKKNKHTI